ncbi:MAG: hypothetical protein QCH35_09955 [Methanomicrobiaceae archaeon]|nr:hypothetical protein [Methanomicrobiaceae archaeon]
MMPDHDAEAASPPAAAVVDQLGLAPGRMVDLRTLVPPERDCSLEVYVYFDPDLARHSTLTDDLRDFDMVPDLGRPFMRLIRFLAVMTEHDPGFAARIEAEPFPVEIVEVGKREEFFGCVLHRSPFVKVLLPPPA